MPVAWWQNPWSQRSAPSIEEFLRAGQKGTGMPIQRSMLVLLGGVAALLVVGIVVVVVASQRPEATFPPGSPEATVADYLRFLQNGQLDRAYALTAMQDRTPGGSAVTFADFSERFGNWSQTPHRVTLLHVSTTGDQASVSVQIATFSNGTFGPSDRASQQTFTLERSNGAWRITGPAYLYV